MYSNNKTAPLHKIKFQPNFPIKLGSAGILLLENTKKPHLRLIFLNKKSAFLVINSNSTEAHEIHPLEHFFVKRNAFYFRLNNLLTTKIL